MLSHSLNQMVWVTKEYDRIKRYYTRKAGKGVIAVLDNTTRGKPSFHQLCSSDVVRRQISSGEDSDEDSVDVTLMEALAQCY